MHTFKAFCFLLAFSLVAGCQEAPPEVSTVTGIVSLDGKPLEKVSVQFIPISGLEPASGAVTDENGQYELEYAITNDRDLSDPIVGYGALPGEHRVVVADYKMMDELLPPPGRIPEQYTDPSTTPLRFKVGEGPQEIDIQL